MSPVCVIRCDVILNYYFHKKSFITQVALIWLLSRIMELTTKQTFVCYITQIYHDVTFYIFNYGHKITVCSIVLGAFILFFTNVYPQMQFQIKIMWESFVILTAFIWFLSSVSHQMWFKTTISQKSFIMLVTFMEALQILFSTFFMTLDNPHPAPVTHF